MLRCMRCTLRHTPRYTPRYTPCRVRVAQVRYLISKDLFQNVWWLEGLEAACISALAVKV